MRRDKTSGRTGKCSGLHQCGGHYPFGGGPGDRRGAADAVSAYLIFGTLGWLIPTKRSKEIVLPSWFRLGEKGGRTVAAPKVLDTSAIIDGRFFDVYKTGIIEGIVMIPQFVLDELRHIADSTDSVKRVRGRRGLDMLQDIQNSAAVQSIAVYSRDYPDIAEVDAKLLRFASEHHAMIVTTDYNLNKVATVQKVPVFNINDLANALRSSVAAGEDVVVDIVKEGKEFNQGVAYFNDGTMVVVDGAKRYVGKSVTATVTSVLQTSAGKMVFAKLREE